MNGLSLLQWNLGNFDVRPRLPGTGYKGFAYTHASPSREEDLGAVAAILRAERPDVVTLQEVLVRAGHHRRLAEAAGYEVACAGSDEGRRHTQAVLVRAGLARAFEPVEAPPVIDGVGCRVRLEGGASLTVFSNHSDAGICTPQRVAQHRALAEWARGVRGPLLIGGDFNFDDAPGSLHDAAERLRGVLPLFPRIVTTDWEADRRALGLLREALSDLGAAGGATAGAPRLWTRILLPLGLPLIPLAWALGATRLRSRLDYVFASSPLEAASTRVLRVCGPEAEGHPAAPGAFPWMDHDPVLVRLA